MNDNNIPQNGMPEAPSESLDDIDISNKGQRMAVILVVIIIIAAAVGGFWVYSQKQKKKEAILQVKKDFSAVHKDVYKGFWQVAKLDLDRLKNNVMFEAQIKEYLKASPVAYARHIKTKALPLLDEMVTKYKALKAPDSLATEVAGVADAVEKLSEAWKKFSANMDMYENYLDNKAKLDDAGDKWFGAQQEPEKEKYTAEAVRYVKLVNCILVDKTLLDFEPVDLSYRIKDTCAKVKEQAAWFKRVAFGCMDVLSQAVKPDEFYEQAKIKYNKSDPRDTKSKFGINQCLSISQDTFETEQSDAVFKAVANYVKAQNALLAAVDKKAKEI
jgi:hypothetical protein